MSNTNNPPSRPALAKSAELRQIIPVGRTRFYQMIGRPDFPEPIRLTPGGGYLWFLDEVYAWLEDQRVGQAQRRRPPRPPGGTPPESPEEVRGEEAAQFRVVSPRERRDTQPARDLPDIEFHDVASDPERVA